MQVTIQDVTDENLILTQAARYEREQCLFYIQQKIYRASQECNNLMVHSLQKLLMSLTSIRGLATETARLNKWQLAKDNSSTVNEILMFWCLEAEWQAKIKKHHTCRKQYFYLNKASLHSHIISLQNIDLEYLLAKLQSIDWIEQSVSRCFYLQYFAQERRYIPNIFKNSISFKITGLLYTIMQLGIDWNYYTQKFHHQPISMLNKNVIHETYLFNSICKNDTASYRSAKQFFYNSSGLKQELIDTSVSEDSYFRQAIQHMKAQFMHEMAMSLKILFYSKDYLGRYRINCHRLDKITARNTIEIIDIITIYYRTLKLHTCIEKMVKCLFDRLKIWAKKNGRPFNKNILNQLAAI
uniref:Reverse transcriptase N-terminal domain-containing protein n=1 Tax=Izziella formosana TaxID=1653389 RepID=A0A1G4NV31_9FLOR|nr:Hypothetical protein ORF_3 [Izziella formosana]SCW22349.1 Hypothetical protein ORF_3 [Izziella formosana]